METANSEITALPGCYLLVILGEPLCENHKEKILQRVAKGLLSWNTEETQCDLKHLEQVCDNLKTSQKSSAKTELLLQHSTDKLAVEVLFNPQIFTLKQCLRNLLLSPTGHKHVIHAGYSFTGSGSWILQDGIFRFHDFVDELSDPSVTKVLSLYPPGCSLKMHLHCSPTGDWVTNNLENQAFSHFMHLSLNPPDSPNGVPGASSLLEFIEGSLETLEGEEKLEPSPLIGNIRFERPTMYIFPSGQGDCSLFGVTGFTMLIDGGFTRFPCFWKFVRHIERLDSIMITRINESNLWGILSLLRGKQESSLYLKIGYVFCNIVDKSINSSEEGVNSENGGVASIQSNPNDLTISIIEVGNEIASRLKRIGCNPHQCLRDPTPTQLTLYHKVGHGTLEMFILSPPRDSRLLKDFLAHWSSNKDSLPVVRTRSACKNGGQSGQDIAIPISDVMSICCLLIWKPSNPNDRITRILFPGSAPQSQIMEGLASLKDLDLLQKRVCTASSLKQSKSKSTVKSTVRISETSSSTATQKLSTRYRSVSPSMRKTRVPYAKQSSTEVGDKGGDSSESQSSPVKRKLIPATNHQTETSRVTRVSTRESVKKTTNEEKKTVKNVTEKKTKTRTSSTTRSTTNKATSKPTSEPTSEANETVKARPITSKQVRARINSRRVSEKTTSEADNETKKEIQSCTVTAENGDSDFSDKKQETVEVGSEDDHRDSGKGSEDASPKKLPFLDHLRDEVEPDSLESYEIYGNVEISKDSLEHSEDEVVTGDSRSTSQLDHMISREDDDEDMKSRSSPIQEDSNLQSAMVSSLSSNMSEMTIISGDKNDDSASDLEVASLTSRINNNQMSRSIEISHVEGSRRKSTDSNGSFRTLEAEIKAACMEEDRQSIGASSRKSSVLSDPDKRRDSIVKENIFASETTSHGKQEIEKSPVPERRRSSIISGGDAYRRASISKGEDKLERKLSKSNEYQIEQEIADSKVDTKLGEEVSTGEIVSNKEQGSESPKADSLEFKEESIERFSEKLTQNEMQISSEKKKDSSDSLEGELPKGSIEEGESLRKYSVRLSIDKSVEEKKIEESTIKSEIETSGQSDIEPIVPESKDNVNEAEVISKETDIDSKEILSVEKEKLLIDSSKSHSGVSSELLSQSQSAVSLDIQSTKQTVDDKSKIVQPAGQSLTYGSDEREALESVTDSQQSIAARTESTSESEKKKREEEQLTLKKVEILRKDSITSEYKAESQVCDENVGAYKIDEEEQKVNSESISSIETSKQSKVTSSEEPDRKMSGGISSSKETANKDLDDKLNTTEGDDIKQDSFASRRESIKTSETSTSDGTKPESRKGSLASGETKPQATSKSTVDEYSNVDDDSEQLQETSLKRESVSDVFDYESEKGTKNIEIGFDVAIKTESLLDQTNRKESEQLDGSSISGDSRKQSLTSEARKSIDSPLSPIDRKESIQFKDPAPESITHEDSSQIGRKDSVLSDFDKNQSVDSRRSTETEIQYNTMTSMDSKTSGETFSSIQDERKESVQLAQVRSSTSDDSRKQSVSSEAIKSNELLSLSNQTDRKESVRDTESIIADDHSAQMTRKDSVQSDFDHRQSLDSRGSIVTETRSHTVEEDITISEDSLASSPIARKDSAQFDLDKSKYGDSRRSTVAEIQYNTMISMESDSKIFDQTSSVQDERRESVQMDKERSSISGDSRRSTETDIQYKASVGSDSKVSTETSSSSPVTRKYSVQSDKDRSSISDYPRKQSLSAETRKSIDSDEIKRKESISQLEDKVFTDSVPASPLTKHQDKSDDEIIQSNTKHEDSSIEVEKSTENIESKNTQQSNSLEKVPFETENLNLSKSESNLSDNKKGDDDQKSHDISSQLTSTIGSTSLNEKSDEQVKVDKIEFENKLETSIAIKSNDETENKAIAEHRRKPSIDMTSNKLSTITTTTDSSSTESKTTITTEQINSGASMIGGSYLGSDARTSFIETNISNAEDVGGTKAIVTEIDDAARKSMLVDKSISLDSIDTTDSIKQSTSDKFTNKSTTSGNTLVQSGDSFAQQTSELKRESFSKVDANNQLYSTLTESFDDIQVDLQSTKSSNLTSSNFSDAKFLNKSESLSSENATHSTKFDTVMSIDEETYFYLEDSDSLAQDGHSMASIASDKRVTKEAENNKITFSEALSSLSSATQKHEDFISSTQETKQQLFKHSELSSSSEAEQPVKTIETSQESQMGTKDAKLTGSSNESRVERDGSKISGSLVSDSVQEKMIIKSSNESGSTVMIEERSSVDYKPLTSFSGSSFDSFSASSRTNQTKVKSENLMSLKEEMDKSKSISSSDESQLKTSDEALSGKIMNSSAYSGASYYTEEEPFESEYAPFAKCVGIKKTPSQHEPDSWTNMVSTTKSFTVESSDKSEGEQARHNTKQYEDEVIEEKMKSPTLSNQSSAKLVSPTLSPLPGQSFDKLSRDIVDKGVSLRSMAATELASSIVHLETSVTKVTTNLNLPEVINEEAGSKGDESPDLSSPKQATNDFIAKVETAPGAGTLATTFPTAGEMPSVHLRRSAQMAGQVLYEVPDEEDNIESPLSEKKPVGLARGTTSSKEFPEVLHISEETTPSTPSETQSPRDAKSLTQTTTVIATSMDITSPQDSKSGLCCFPRSIELDGAKKGKEEKVTSTSTSETTTRVVTQSQNLTEEQKKEKEATLKEWGTPLGLPKPTDANDSKGARSASKSRAISSDRTGASRSYSSRRSGSSSDQGKPIYLDLAYIPHHGDRHYCNADYFKRIRARYYVLSSVNPSKEVLDALIEGKKSWEDKAEVTLIPSHETEALCLWMATNQQTLEDLNIDVAPSASRCSVILQDQESSCSAYRVEF